MSIAEQVLTEIFGIPWKDITIITFEYEKEKLLEQIKKEKEYYKQNKDRLFTYIPLTYLNLLQESLNRNKNPETIKLLEIQERYIKITLLDMESFLEIFKKLHKEEITPKTYAEIMNTYGKENIRQLKQQTTQLTEFRAYPGKTALFSAFYETVINKYPRKGLQEYYKEQLAFGKFLLEDTIIKEIRTRFFKSNIKLEPKKRQQDYKNFDFGMFK